MNGQDIINFIKKFGLEKKEFDTTKEEPQVKQQNITVTTPETVNTGDKEALFSQNVGALHEMYRSGKLRLTKDERELLEFCHNTDMRAFLREEFRKNPTPDKSYFTD